MINNEPWFVAKDVCDALEIKNATQLVKRLEEDEVTRFNLGGLSNSRMVKKRLDDDLVSIESIPDSLGRMQAK